MKKQFDKVLKNYNYRVMPIVLIIILSRKFLDKLTTYYWKFSGVKVGKGSVIQRGFKTNCPKKIIIGKKCLISKGVTVTTECPLNSAMLKISDDCQINNSVKIDITGGVLIQKNSLISADVTIFTHSHGNDPKSHPIGLPLIISDNCWIGEKSIIMHGVSEIGRNSIIGCGTIVTKNTNFNDIIVGASTRTLERKK
jgi:acetyltransferase-like isoleucine patch superfamily enzyme